MSQVIAEAEEHGFGHWVVPREANTIEWHEPGHWQCARCAMFRRAVRARTEEMRAYLRSLLTQPKAG